MNRKIVPISITDEKMLNHLESKENKSLYIRSLIKKDMEQEELSPDIKKIIEDYIKNNYGPVHLEMNEGLKNYKDEIDEIFNI